MLINKFYVGQVVFVDGPNEKLCGAIALKGKAEIASISSSRPGTNGKKVVVYNVRFVGNNSTYLMSESVLSEIKTKKLFAYVDKTDEVHFATRLYTPKELKSFELVRDERFDRTIELE